MLVSEGGELGEEVDWGGSWKNFLVMIRTWAIQMCQFVKTEQMYNLISCISFYAHFPSKEKNCKQILNSV